MLPNQSFILLSLSPSMKLFTSSCSAESVDLPNFTFEFYMQGGQVKSDNTIIFSIFTRSFCKCFLEVELSDFLKFMSPNSLLPFSSQCYNHQAFSDQHCFNTKFFFQLPTLLSFWFTIFLVTTLLLMIMLFTF